ncbi:hypothetical protein NKV53_01315 [Legionella sp. 27cVA30]|uniref:Sel1 repeat family protein n=1 Tax=Legionella septentrionalis TaxID=2498109 RepID=A0A3S0WZA3_9GAMM|nr:MULTISPECIES: hypothetical protein [Legionella]MCP0913014.1 hypothetical protein [Legionella sp. 27cVA30]RUQ81674.1 hypothetical protein EKM59_09825 [Legionella septentrionalis]RUR15348.1 hypothetical protein ELY10_05975 [Legionella septentrionalis]
MPTPTASIEKSRNVNYAGLFVLIEKIKKHGDVLKTEGDDDKARALCDLASDLEQTVEKYRFKPITKGTKKELLADIDLDIRIHLQNSPIITKHRHWSTWIGLLIANTAFALVTGIIIGPMVKWWFTGSPWFWAKTTSEKLIDAVKEEVLELNQLSCLPSEVNELIGSFADAPSCLNLALTSHQAQNVLRVLTTKKNEYKEFSEKAKEFTAAITTMQTSSFVFKLKQAKETFQQLEPEIKKNWHWVKGKDALAIARYYAQFIDADAETFFWTKIAADKRVPMALFNMGTYHNEGRRTAVKSVEIAADYFLRIADTKDEEAAVALRKYLQRNQEVAKVMQQKSTAEEDTKPSSYSLR